MMAAIAVLLTVNGCSPVDSGQMDEEKEPHFVLGNSRFNEMDWPGAVDAFEQSLEVNPHSAQAHYRLAQLFDSKISDPAAAIYHYQQYLKMSPEANNRDLINQRIDSCKQQLATAVLQLPSTPGAQKQVDALVEQNRALAAQVDNLRSNLNAWVAYATSLKNNQTAAGGNAGGQGQATSSMPDDISQQSDTSSSSTAKATAKAKTTASTTSVKKTVAPKPPTVRKHIVLSGETMSSIAKKQGVSLASLQAVNPGVNPRKLRAGQSLNLPP
ncbi:MAG TPA: LysM peptidoglycan-binding domain-containing protein [Verrucomicrobiae bacterium]